MKAVNLWHFATFSNISLDIHAKFGMPNLPQSSDIGQNSDRDISNFQISGQSLSKVYCHNSITCDDIYMKLEPVTKLDKSTKQSQKKLALTICQQILTSLSIFQFMANMEQYGSQILGKLSVKITFSLKVTFFLTNRTWKSLLQLSRYCFE